jgi:hypothetical protein
MLSAQLGYVIPRQLADLGMCGERKRNNRKKEKNGKEKQKK